jgi:hypothetical protein
MTNQTVSDLLGAIERIGPLIAEHATTAEADRQLSGAVYQAMYDAACSLCWPPKPMAVWSCTRPITSGSGKRSPASMPRPRGTW